MGQTYHEARALKNEDRIELYLLAFRSFTVTQSREYVTHLVKDRAYELEYNPADVVELINEAIDDVVAEMQKNLRELRINAKSFALSYASKFVDMYPPRRGGSS